MKIKYKGPHGLVEVPGAGVFERYVSVEVNDEIAKTLIASGAFEKDLISKKKEEV